MSIIFHDAQMEIIVTCSMIFAVILHSAHIIDYDNAWYELTVLLMYNAVMEMIIMPDSLRNDNDTAQYL